MDELGISKLPAPILRHILFFLFDEKEAVRTCVLSKSWRHVWSTRPKFSLDEFYFRKDKEKFTDFLDKSLHVYYDRKLCFEELRVTMSKINPGMVLLLEKWIPIVSVNKFHLSFSFYDSVLPSVVFQSESLQELFLETCNLRQIQINSVVGNNKTLHLQYVRIEDDKTFAEFLSSCSLIEDLSLRYCQGLRTINMPNHHNLKSFELKRINDDGSKIEIYLPSSVGRIIIDRCPNWYHHRNYFPGLTYLELRRVPLSHEWFNSFSRNFPCLEELRLFDCNGNDEFELSSRSIKKLHIYMDESPTTKATIDTPSIKECFIDANISQSISLTATTSSEWISDIQLSLDLDASQWLLKLSELVAAFSQSKIISLELFHSSDFGNPNIEHPSDILICCGDSYKPVAIESLSLVFNGVYYDFFLSDLVIGLFRFVRPREIKQKRINEFLCRTLQMGRWEEEEEGMRSFLFWKHDLEKVSLQERDCYDEWHPVEGTINWSEYVAATTHRFYELRFRLKWRECS